MSSELEARIDAYELAFRMQTAAPELVDLAGESEETSEAKGGKVAGSPAGGKRTV